MQVYQGHILSMTSHIIALGVAAYAAIDVSLLDTLTGSSDNPGTALFVCLFLFLLVEIGITVRRAGCRRLLVLIYRSY